MTFTTWKTYVVNWSVLKVAGNEVTIKDQRSADIRLSLESVWITTALTNHLVRGAYNLTGKPPAGFEQLSIRTIVKWSLLWRSKLKFNHCCCCALSSKSIVGNYKYLHIFVCLWVALDNAQRCLSIFFIGATGRALWKQLTGIQTRLLGRDIVFEYLNDTETHTHTGPEISQI